MSTRFLAPSASTGDASVVAGDALVVINRINGFGPGPVPANAPFGPPYYDTNGDNSVAANDVLGIINHINAFGSGTPGPSGEGEATISPDLADLLFYELGSTSKPRRR